MLFGLVIGIVIGANLGLVIFSLLSAGKKSK